MKTYKTLSEANATVGECIRVRNSVIDAIYRRLDLRSAESKTRAEYGDDPKWYQVSATISPSGHLK